MLSLSIISETMNVPLNVVEKLKEIKENDTKISYRDVISRIKSQLNYDMDTITAKMLRCQIVNVNNKKNEVLGEINDAIDDKPKYDIIDDHYILYAKDKLTQTTVKFSIPVSTVDEIFNDFSKHGANLTGQAIMNKYSLKPKVWNLIKSHIGLYKDSHILSPLSMDNASKDGTIDEVIQEASYKNFEDKYKHKYREAHIDIMEKEVKKLAKIVGTLDGFIEYITPKLNITPLQFDIHKIPQTNENKPVYVFGDKHFGKRDTDGVITRLNQLAQDIIADQSSEVVLVDLGDHYEALMQGGMHSGQTEGMDGKYMGELFMYGVQVYSSFLTTIIQSGKKVIFKGMGGNHDRISTKNEGDNERMFSTIFYEMLKMYFARTDIEIEYFSKRLGLFTIDNIDYAINHGEEFGKIRADALRSKVSTKTNNHLVALFAHYHSASIEQGNRITKVGIPGLAGENDYDERLLLKSDPGYVRIQENRHGKPSVEYNFFDE